jgi:hypothetical protein
MLQMRMQNMRIDVTVFDFREEEGEGSGTMRATAHRRKGLIL